MGSALARDMDVIDTTEGITAIQQEYYNRISRANIFKRSQSPEVKRLRNLYRHGFDFGSDYIFRADHANLKYTSNGIRKRPFELWDIRLFMTIQGPAKYPQLRPIFKTAWSIWFNRTHQHNPIIRRLLRWAGGGTYRYCSIKVHRLFYITCLVAIFYR